MFQCNMLVQRQHQVSGGKWRLSLSDTHLFYCRPTVAVTWEAGRRFWRRVKIRTAGYIACSVNGH